jgi:hypothetical protein
LSKRNTVIAVVCIVLACVVASLAVAQSEWCASLNRTYLGGIVTQRQGNFPNGTSWYQLTIGSKTQISQYPFNTASGFYPNGTQWTEVYGCPT